MLPELDTAKEPSVIYPENKGFVPQVHDIILGPEEVPLIENVLSKLLAERPNPDDVFFDQAAVAAQELPRRIREELYFFRRRQPYPGILVKGFPVDDSAIGPTPSEYRGEMVKTTPVTREQALHALLASLLGEPIAWTTQQSGNFFNDIIPIQTNADRAISSGSNNLFDLHTEDAALYPHTPDYLGLMGLRNRDRVPTIISSVDWQKFDPDLLLILSQPRFIIGVNMAHTLGQPQEPTPIVFGNPGFPYLRVNLNLQHTIPNDFEAEQALGILTAELNRNIVDVVVGQGEYFYLDNNVAAHGRRAYEPRYDGTDRWLQRLTIVSNPRNFQDITLMHGSRLLEPTLVSR